MYRSFVTKSKYGNKKVQESDGTKSDSKLESYMKRQLEMFGIRYEQQVKYVLMESFRHNNKAVREISYKLDFKVFAEDGVFAVETKGFFTPDGKIKWKLFLSKYREDFSNCLIIKNQKDVNLFISSVI